MGLLDSRSVSAVYSIPAPTTDGSYTVSTGLSLVMDVDSNAMAPGVVGAFPVQIMVPAANGPDLTAALVGKSPTSFLAGASCSLRVRITNSGNSVAKGAAKLTAFASADGTLATTDELIAPTSGGAVKLNLKPRASAIVNIRFAVPLDLAAGTYRIGAWVDSSNAIAETNEMNNTASSGPVMISMPFQSIKGTFSDTLPPLLTRGRNATIAVSAANLGNISIGGKMSLSFTSATDEEFDDGNTSLGTVTIPRVKIAPGHHSVFRVSLRIPADAGTGQRFVAVILSSSDSGGATDTAVDPTPVKFV